MRFFSCLNMSWQEVREDSDFEIWTEYPYQIRRKSNQRIVKETIHKIYGYIGCRLNNKKFRKHRIIANNFIENPNNYEFVDHINHIRTDNRIENLRWVSNRMNTNNRSDQIFVDEISDEAIVVEKYGDWEFEFLYFDPETDTFYVYNGINYTVKTRYQNKAGNWKIAICDKNNKQRSIYYNKFKEEYGLI